MAFLRAILQRAYLGLRKIFATGKSGYLCDTCRWDYGDACKRPERPNAKTCPEYRRR